FPSFRAGTESEASANKTTTPTSSSILSPAFTSASPGGTNIPLKDTSNLREDGQKSLKSLETLAQKTGICFDEDLASTSPSQTPSSQTRDAAGTSPIKQRRHPLLPLVGNSPRTPISTRRGRTLEKSQSPAQQVAAATTVPLQISPEQLQQLYASNPYAIQVKQEFPTHTTGAGTELKHATNILDVQQQMQLQQQLSDANGAGGAAGGTGVAGGAPSPANSQQTQQQQHSTAISTMSPMQLAAATGGVGGDWAQGRTVQLMQPSTSFLYPQMIVSGNLLHPGGLGQQPIQVITAGKPFQGNTPQMITTTTQNAKQMIGGQTQFAGGTYASCIPSNHSQSPQTLLISPVNVISHSPQQQQNLLQSMAAAAQQQQQQQQLTQQQQQQQQISQQQQQQQQQLTAALAKVGVDAQGKMAQKVVQKVTTTSSTVQAATAGGAAATAAQAQQVQQVQQQQQQTTQTTQQCVQVSQSTLPVGVGVAQAGQSVQSVQAAQLLNAGQAQQMQIPWFWQNAAGLQSFGSNPIILRGQPDGTSGMFIQQPTTQTLQTQQNQIIQCNVTQTPPKARTQLDALAPKQQQQQAGTANQAQQQQQQQQLAVATAQLQQQQLTAAALQRPGAPIMPHNGTQVRPASSVSTQTAQNQSLLKGKMRTKQQPVRPALSALKTENGQLAGQNKVVGHMATVQQQQQATANLQQVVNSAGNKMVVMSTTGTPITLQNGQTLHAATAGVAGVDKQQQQQQLQLIQKQQYLQQQMFQQQIAALQMQQQAAAQAQQQQQQQVTQQQQQVTAQQQQAVAQAQQQQREQQQQVAQAQAQQQQALANATQQILQVAPNTFITSHQQQQQQLHNQLIQQQLQQQVQAQAQVQAHVQAQAQAQQQQQQQQQQREQQQNIIQQIVVSGGATSQQQQQNTGQLQLNNVPFTVSSTTTPAGIATSSALQAALSASGAIFQTAKPGTCSSSLPTSSVVTITNQSSTPLVTSSTVASLQQAQAQAQLQQQQQQLITTAMAVASQQQQQQQQQQGPPSLTATTPSPTTNPILAMTSMMNATVGHLSSAPPVTVSVTSTAVTPSPGQLVTLSSASTPTKETPSKTATLVPIGSPMTPASVSAQDRSATPKSSTPANASASVEASSSTGEALPNGEVTEAASTPTRAATTPTSKQSNVVQPTSSSAATPSTPSGKEETKVATSTSSSAATTPTTTKTVSNGIGTGRSTACTTGSTTVTTTTTVSTTTTCSSANSTTTTTICSNGAKDLPKAMIKPNVLTHVIDGFIIQEANEPFPVTRQRYADKDVADEPPKKKAAMQEDMKPSGIASAPASDMVACEQCGKLEHKTKLKRKRFCSPGCARQAKNGSGGGGMETGETNGLGTGGIVGVDAMALVDKLDEAMAEEKMQTEALQAMSEPLPILAAPTEALPPLSLPVLATAIPTPAPLALPLPPLPLGLPLPVAIPAPGPLPAVIPAAAPAPTTCSSNGTDRPPISSWSVEEVSNFIRELPGCQDYVDDFIQQEIDGQALLLLKENHLVHAMGMKLGPALKIVAKVESMKEVSPPADGKE
ncbi:hypothetical protein KR059_001920, partial [Drosophila kikkawai]